MLGTHKDNAYKFLTYMLRPEVAAKISTKFSLPSINKNAEVNATNLIYKISDMDKAQILTDIGDKLNIKQILAININRKLILKGVKNEIFNKKR